MSTKPPSFAVIILTKNEERDLAACLDSLRGLATEVHVVDSGSTDQTVAIAQRFGASVLTHSFVNYAEQFNWALDHVESSAEWIMRIDADERVSSRLRQELMSACTSAPEGINGLLVPLRIRFLGRDLRHGDTYPVWLMRVWRRGEARCENAWMDEHMVLQKGSTMRVSGDLIHDIPKELTGWTAKHNWYASRECLDVSRCGSPASLDDQAGTKRWLKQNLYLRLPLFYRVFFYWFYRYFIRFGFLDGKEGMIYHFLQGFWYRFLVDAKLYEAQSSSRRFSMDALPSLTRAPALQTPVPIQGNFDSANPRH